jgi:hypothetical protein
MQTIPMHTVVRCLLVIRGIIVTKLVLHIKKMIHLGEEGGLNRSKSIFIFFIRMQEFCTLTGNDVNSKDGSMERERERVCVCVGDVSVCARVYV